MAKDNRRSSKTQELPKSPASSNGGESLSNQSIACRNSNLNETIMTSPMLSFQGSKIPKDPSLFQTSLRNATQELTELILSISQSVNKESIKDKEILDLDTTDVFDWHKVLQASESVFQEYTTDIGELLDELDELNKQLIIWQESTYILDMERANVKIGSSEAWVQQKELYLKLFNSEINTSAGLINDALRNLSGSQ